MTERTWINPAVDRSQWGRGAWDGEPDKVQWTDADTGLPCLARRHDRLGHWCGYVGVAPGHQWHGKDYEAFNANVHGGLTFAGGCDHGPIERSICHLPEPGESDNVWWLGFDCAHADDRSPGMDVLLKSVNCTPWPNTYRTLDYVRLQCRHLAHQLHEKGTTPP